MIIVGVYPYMSLDMNVQLLLNDLYLTPYFNTRTAWGNTLFPKLSVFRSLSLSPAKFSCFGPRLVQLLNKHSTKTISKFICYSPRLLQGMPSR